MTYSQKKEQDSANEYNPIPQIFDKWVDCSTDGFYIADGNGYTLRVNKAYEKMSGFKPEELVGRHLSELVAEGYFAPSAILMALDCKKPVTIVSSIKNTKNVIITAIPIFNAQGKISAVVSTLRDNTEYKKLQEEYKKLQEDLQDTKALNEKLFKDKLPENCIAENAKMLELFDLAKQIAPYPTSVLISGESGVGKEVIAKHIYSNSARVNEPYIKINCGAIPAQLLESELFGYESGAFTGAKKTGKPGLFEIANKGTIFLDEIGELPINLQVKLLRVLQEGELTRIGGTKPVKIDIRFISASNKDLSKMVHRGEFREDLFFRLNVINIHIPPIRERKDEIITLANLFLEDFCKKYSLKKVLSKEVQECLLRYKWPGNVRELRNLIENVIVSNPKTIIDYEDLPERIKENSHHTTYNTFKPLPLKEVVGDFEKEFIKKTLATQKTVRAAAEILGIDHSTLSRKLSRYNIELPK